MAPSLPTHPSRYFSSKSEFSMRHLVLARRNKMGVWRESTAIYPTQQELLDSRQTFPYHFGEKRINLMMFNETVIWAKVLFLNLWRTMLIVKGRMMHKIQNPLLHLHFHHIPGNHLATLETIYYCHAATENPTCRSQNQSNSSSTVYPISNYVSYNTFSHKYQAFLAVTPFFPTRNVT